MSMSEKDFGICMSVLIGAYPGKFGINEYQVPTYYSFLKKYKPNDLYIVCGEWVLANKFPPTISDLVDGLKERGCEIED